MKSVVDQLAMYSCYHRDGRNVATHMVGIPFIVLALLALLSRPEWSLGGFLLTPAIIVVTIGVLYYLLLDVILGIIMAVLLALGVWLGFWFAALSTQVWLAFGIGLFVVGWVFQFVGHAYEGRKPAFVDDIMGLAIGPLFVVAELMFLLGLRKTLYKEVEIKVAEVLPTMPPVTKSK